jgi:hypothetical protein
MQSRVPKQKQTQNFKNRTGSSSGSHTSSQDVQENQSNGNKFIADKFSHRRKLPKTDSSIEQHDHCSKRQQTSTRIQMPINSKNPF